MFDRFSVNPDRFSVCSSTSRSYATARQVMKTATRRASRRLGAPRAIAEGLAALGEETPIVAALFAFDADGDSVRGFSTVAEARACLRWYSGSDVWLLLVEFDEPQPAWEGWETSWTGDQYGEAPLGTLLGAPRTILADVTIAPSEWVEEDPWTRVHHIGADSIRRRAWEEAANERWSWPYRIEDWLRANP